MLHRMKSAILTGVALALALSATACSSLTRPEEITIAAEPLPSPRPPTAVDVAQNAVNAAVQANPAAASGG